MKGICEDCGKDVLTLDGERDFNSENRDLFMVTKELWTKYGVGKAWLCLSCFEKRLGRKLTKVDFIDCKLNKVKKLI